MPFAGTQAAAHQVEVLHRIQVTIALVLQVGAVGDDDVVPARGHAQPAPGIVHDQPKSRLALNVVILRAKKRRRAGDGVFSTQSTLMP